ncbi:MATE family efflux transporter [Psychromonas sp. PT13]|uniref:MATE family efflux transporter n=1 Tax=Psychromonas sp. PT13 TaxID=3439547 RepID=UPI003EBD82E8
MPKLIQFDVKQTLFRMALPMLVGTITMNAYNLADTMYVAQLGTLPLAAMGFTFPVVMFFTLVASGVGTGITALSSNAMGRKDNDAAANIVTHGVCLIILFSILLAVCGYLSVNIIFNMLGADDQTLPFVRNYMNTWYFGAVFMAIPMMGNGILISLGDSKSASRFMALGAIVNIILDPIFIFGWLGVPALGILGAALATVISQAISSCWLFYLLAIKYPLIKFRQPNFSALLHSWKRIASFAIPASMTMMLMPISGGVITALISQHGVAAVAGVSAASRMEMFAFVIPMALGMSLTPFVSQNYGGQRIDRIIEARKYATLFALGYGVFIALVFFIGAPYLAQLFTQDPDVTDVFITYVRTISFGYGMMEVHRYSGFFLTGMNRPVHTTLLTFTRVLVLLLPLSFLGSAYWGVSGIFTGRLITDLLSGAIGLLWVGVFLKAKIQAKS